MFCSVAAPKPNKGHSVPRLKKRKVKVKKLLKRKRKKEKEKRGVK